MEPSHASPARPRVVDLDAERRRRARFVQHAVHRMPSPPSLVHVNRRAPPRVLALRHAFRRCAEACRIVGVHLARTARAGVAAGVGLVARHSRRVRAVREWIVEMGEVCAVSNRYVLSDERHVLACPDMATWAAFMRNGKRLVAEDAVAGVTITTRFVGVDVAPRIRERIDAGEAPLPFETSLRGLGYTGNREFWASWDDAERGHRETVARFIEFCAAPTRPEVGT